MAVTSLMTVIEFGLNFQKTSIEASVSNISNANVAQVAGGDNYRPLEAVYTGSFADKLSPELVRLEQSDVPMVKRYQVDHPLANSEGFVSYANIDLAKEMINLTEASRSYEANIQAFNTHMSMILKAMEIGK